MFQVFKSIIAPSVYISGAILIRVSTNLVQSCQHQYDYQMQRNQQLDWKRIIVPGFFSLDKRQMN